MSVKSYFIQRSANAIRKVALSRFPSLRAYKTPGDPGKQYQRLATATVVVTAATAAEQQQDDPDAAVAEDTVTTVVIAAGIIAAAICSS